MRTIEQATDEAAILLHKAVTILCEQGYSSLPKHVREACDWANMAHDQLKVRHQIPVDGCVYGVGILKHPAQPRGFANRWKRQDVRIAKANRRVNKRKWRTGHLY